MTRGYNKRPKITKYVKKKNRTFLDKAVRHFPWYLKTKLSLLKLN